ncbi:ERF family protein [Mesorhizobium sp. Z1-4]|uniref:ERF family protein n=1 Tax=Mesorhizobium sp. Z1-4 TaxID=2448478 RepID=UPI000FDC9EE2|nr:ERF family protein [Mesorhizobium sp. Z1-4]
MSATIAKALHEVMSKVGYVQKTGKNAFHGYKYAGEADLLDKLRPAMLEAGLLLIPSVKRVSPVDDHGNVSVEMEYTLAHKDGDVWPEKIGAAGMGNDRAKNGAVGDKGVYKAITGANKYVLFKLFQIETGDDPEVVSEHDKGAEPTAKRQSSASLKRDDVWTEMTKEIRECGTPVRLNTLRQAWSKKAVADKWPTAWCDAAAEEFDKAEKELRAMAERDAIEANGHDLRNHPLNAG